MESARLTFKKRLSYLACAIALVVSVSLYRSSFGTNPLSAAQNHWEAIATENPKRLAEGYSKFAVLERSYAIADVDKVYRGQSIYDAWREFFEQYQIKDFRVIEQKQHEHSVEAEIQITAKSSLGETVVLSMSYQVQFDHTGKITKEVWLARPEVSV